VATVLAVVRWHAPILGKHVSLVIVPFGGTLAPYEALVRRFRVTRFLFGRKPAPRLTDLEGHTK
jgi:glucans biosynthesis protein C